MKIKSYIQNQLGLSECISIEAIFQEKEKILYQFIHMKRTDESLVFVNRQKNIESFEELQKHLKKHIPIVLTLSGKGILIKEIENPDPEQNPVRRLLPNAAAEEFSLQLLSNSKQKSFCALTRTKLIENEIQKFTTTGNFIVAVNMACLSLGSIVNLLDDYHNKITSFEYKISLRGEEFQGISINKYRKSDTIYNIRGMDIESELLLCFSSLFSFFILKKEGIEIPFLTERKNEFRYSRKFRLGKVILLAASFIVLLINYFVFDHYFKKSNRLQADLTRYTQILDKKKDLQESLLKKEESIAMLGLRNNIKFSYVADRILRKMPQNITLESFQLQPKQENRKRELVFQERKIQITGTSPNTGYLNRWILDIQKMEWVEKLSLKDYVFDESKKSANFVLSIHLSDLKNIKP